MSARCTPLRPLTIVFAMLVMAAAMALNATSVQAKCCTVYFYNYTDCKVAAVLNNGASEQLVVIYPGRNKFEIVGCGDWSLTVTDRCTGNEFAIPYTSCPTFSASPGCCLNICPDAYTPCLWNITYSNSCACD